ncbi:MAG TPA: hypothetical protein VID70_10015 [Solirubrobacteraceae bacterium]
MAMRAEARAWWAEVEGDHMRERIERRRVAAERSAPRRRRPMRRPVERVGGRPDRVASWAFALGCLLLLVAIASTHG